MEGKLRTWTGPRLPTASGPLWSGRHLTEPRSHAGAVADHELLPDLMPLLRRQMPFIPATLCTALLLCHDVHLRVVLVDPPVVGRFTETVQ